MSTCWDKSVPSSRGWCGSCWKVAPGLFPEYWLYIAFFDEVVHQEIPRDRLVAFLSGLGKRAHQVGFEDCDLRVGDRVVRILDQVLVQSIFFDREFRTSDPVVLQGLRENEYE